ncbi:MAG: hypothetical protein ABSE49_22480 [Polyangiaceae bacterium]
MRALLRAVLAIAAALPVAGTGCSSSSSPSSSDDGGYDGSLGSAPLGAACILSSDCAEPLTCTFGVCHQQCVAARDCPTGEACVSVSGNGVCLLPQEASCANGASCPSGLECAPDDQCHGSCGDAGVSCLAGQLCTDGLCYDPSAADASPDSPASD